MISNVNNSKNNSYHIALYIPNPSPSVPLSTEVRLVSNQVEKLFLQNKGGYRNGLELQKGRKQGVVT